jgi:glycosyltransferase involved in cell wall biosynthesis
MIRVGYLINQYPKPSHTFITTEMAELERQGFAILRIAVRGWSDAPTNDRDAREQASTRYILKSGPIALLGAAARLALTRPKGFVRALASSVQLSRGSAGGLFKHLIYFVEACWTAHVLTQNKVRHLHAHFGTNTAVVALLIHRITAIPFSFTVHGPEEFDSPRQLKLREKTRLAAFVAAISSYGRSQLFRWIDPKDWPKIKIVRCAPDPSFLESDYVPPPTANRLVCVGRLCEQKGQLLLLEAIERLGGEGISLQLVLAGDGEMRPDVERAIAERGLADSVTITGWIDIERVRAELLRADALVLPSFAEGLPVVIMEAMALGRPVISTLIAGIPELVRDGIDGFLVPSGDVQALADAIRRFLLLDEHSVARMAASCRERVRERHDIRNEAAKLARLIAEQ